MYDYYENDEQSYLYIDDDDYYDYKWGSLWKNDDLWDVTTNFRANDEAYITKYEMKCSQFNYGDETCICKSGITKRVSRCYISSHHPAVAAPPIHPGISRSIP